MAQQAARSGNVEGIGLVCVPDYEWLCDGFFGLARGAATTIYLLIVAAIFGTFFSVLGALCRRTRFKPLTMLIAAYVEIIRNSPFLAQLFLIFFALPSFGIRLDPIPAAIVALTVNFAGYGVEIVGAGIDAVPIGQKEAARSLGLRPWHVFTKIVFPQAVRIIFPAYCSQLVILLLETAVVSQISVQELTHEADLLQIKTFRTFETFLVTTFIYLGLCMVLMKLCYAVGRRLLRGPL